MNDDLDNLEDKIADFQKKRDSKDTPEASEALADKDNGYRAGAELIVNVVAGGAIGFGIDYFVGTMPLFLILFFLTGFGWGLYKVYKITQNLG
jgi:ATP synthase protein I